MEEIKQRLLNAKLRARPLKQAECVYVCVHREILGTQ